MQVMTVADAEEAAEAQNNVDTFPLVLSIITRSL